MVDSSKLDPQAERFLETLNYKIGLKRKTNIDMIERNYEKNMSRFRG